MTEDRIYKAKIIKATVLVIGIFLIGVAGYHFIEGWNLLDSIWMTVITLSTIGFGESHPLSVNGRIFIIFLILTGLGIMGYGLGITATFIVEGELGRLLGRRKMEKDIQKLSNHYIICGAGETGRCVIQEFVKTKTPFVVIENDPTKLNMVRDLENVAYIAGDATKDAILISAGIRRAHGLVSALHSDKDNLFVVLTARSLNENLRIVSRVIEPESEHKLTFAGANSVVSPNFIGGMRMASIMLRPAVVSFLDIMLREENVTMRLEEVILPKGTRMTGISLRDSDIGRQTGLIVIAIKRQEDNKFLYNPNSDTILEENDTLIVLGAVEQVMELRRMVSTGVPA